ncbi:uncharacterized protein [Eurosta solidaginis]|uniref:uncharacterized protein n=1 Tax=Eurosta solidaginis TaxID=178769 RepID=UPI003530F8F3
MSSMLKFLRIISIWICCAFCLLERLQLPVVTAAIATSFEYFEDHDQLSYDLDTEQSEAKYDTRLLSEQMLKSEKSTEHYDESADSHVNVAVGGGGVSNTMTNTEMDDDIESDTDADVDDLQPHERAASCHNNGHKYTHGQKVPRPDPCEICLCMDGEIFCWWELCKKRPPAQIKTECHSNSQQDTSTVRLNEMSSTLGTTAYPTADTMAQQNQQQQPEYHKTPAYSSSLALSSTKHEHKHISDYDKNYQQQQEEHQKNNLASSIKSTKSWQKKKIYQQQQKQKHEQQQKPQYQHKHIHDHTHTEANVGNTPYYIYPPSSGNKILSFPENLPSVLYHDYRTEEHQHHQHQHQQQHLKHQQKKRQMQLQQQLQQQMQQRRQKQQQETHKQQQPHTHNAWQRAQLQSPQYQHNILKGKSAAATNSYAAFAPILYAGGGGSNDGDSNNLSLNADWGMFDGNENVYNGLETDSDILPEPPTKKPKMTAAATTITNKANAAATTINGDSNAFMSKGAMEWGAGEAQSTSSNFVISEGTQATAGHLKQQQPHVRQQSDSIVADNEKSLKMNAPDASSLLQSSSASATLASSLSSTAPPAIYVVNMVTPASAMSIKKADNTTRQHQQKQQYELNIGSSKEDQDDAFHRWLTSTETNNKQNNSNNVNNNNSLEEESMTTARRTYLFGLAGAYDITNTTTTITKATQNQINGTNAQRLGDSSSSNYISNSNKNKNKMDNVYFRSSYNDYSGEYNGSVVNIDILLTTADEQQQQQKQKAYLITQPSSNSQQNTTTAKTTASASNITSLALDNNATTTTMLAYTSTQANSPERQCNVMGTLYKIGDVLPQDTGNCLQCVCIDGSTREDTPRVTCSPHNCPPLVLPDLFDATGY